MTVTIARGRRRIIGQVMDYPFRLVPMIRSSKSWRYQKLSQPPLVGVRYRAALPFVVPGPPSGALRITVTSK